MGAKKILRLFTILSISLLAIACTSTTGPEDDINSPKDKSISVQYIRQLPIDDFQPDVVYLNWNYVNYAGRERMSRTSEDNFNCGAQIRTEIKILMTVEDMRKHTECNFYACKRLFVDGHELIFNGTNCGAVEFIYHNDGSIEITSPILVDLAD